MDGNRELYFPIVLRLTVHAEAVSDSTVDSLKADCAHWLMNSASFDEESAVSLSECSH